MQTVPVSDIVTANIMSGVGPAEITLTAGANPLSEDRTGTATVTAGDQSKEIRITQAAGQQVVVIPEFDFLVLRYSWSADAGTDFDTATGFTNTGIPDVDNVYVGWSRGYTTTKEQVGNYLIHGGDNMQSGREAALINMKDLLGDPQLNVSEPNINVAVYGNWYASKGTGVVTISFTAYLGGEMKKSGFNFENEGGEVVYEGDSSIVVNATGGENFQNITGLYSKVGTVVYNKEDRSCVVFVGE